MDRFQRGVSGVEAMVVEGRLECCVIITELFGEEEEEEGEGEEGEGR